MTTNRSFAIIPAAGASQRMGKRHKLLLPWGSDTVMDNTLWAWRRSTVSELVVVIRRSDTLLQELCNKHGVSMVLPDADPPDMRHSIQAGLQYIADRYGPHDRDRWLVAPADLPCLKTEVVDRLLEVGQQGENVIVPRYGRELRRGHPVSLPWLLAPLLTELDACRGLDALIDAQKELGNLQWLDFPMRSRPVDIDTPEEYDRLREENSAG